MRISGLQVDYDDLETSLRNAFLHATRECQEIGYNPARFLQMLSEHGPVATAIQLVMAKDYHEGFAKLWELGRLDLSSVEAAIILREPHRNLFPSEVLERAQQKLQEVGFLCREGTGST